MTFLRLFVVVALGVACGPDKGETTEGSSSDSGGSSGTTEGGGSTGGSGGSGGVTEGGGMCEPPPGLPVGPAVMITITNMRAEAVFLQGTSGCLPSSGFRVVPAGSSDPLPIDPDCEFSCSDVIAGVECVCQLGCPIDAVIRLDPGVSLVKPWSGGQLVRIQLAEECGAESCGGHCVELTPAPAGAYTVVVPASSTISECQAPCECPPDEVPCTLQGYLGPNDLTVEVALSYPDQTSLEAIIQ